MLFRGELMSACAFFRHRDAPETILPALTQAIEYVIVNKRVSCFYVGTHGAFDRFAYTALNYARTKYPHISVNVVLAYMPSAKDERYGEDSILPEGIEAVPKRFAIHYRNDWMLRRSDYVISYTPHSFGGAARYVDKAKRQNKTIISLS